MNSSEHDQERHEAEEIRKLEARIAGRSELLSARTMPVDWEVIHVVHPRPPLLVRVLIKLHQRLRNRRLARSFRTFGRGSTLARPCWVHGRQSISIGERVTIWTGARLTAVNASSDRSLLEIGDGTAIHPNAHVSAARSVRIGKGVLMAPNCYVTDHDHDWLNPADPPRTNARLLAAPTTIGDHVWLGEKVSVLKGVTIGESCVIGAGSVVSGDIPPFSMAVGSPARVVRTWDHELGAWARQG